MVKVYEDNKIYPGFELPQELKDLQMKYRKFNAGEIIQNMLVDSEMDIKAARWLVWNSAWKTDKGEDARVETAMAKVFSVETLDRVVDRAVQISSGYGVTKIDCPLERLYREARPRRNGRGASEPLRFRVIAPYLEKLGIPEGFAGPRWSKLKIFDE
ncbi:MAG: acyl-CoA dehydrogenase family protein [Thermodesulfobacteriota bacterium]|nr:acyl-CoA dehydrogenase family protein [Thermodesulfobacteriota bacterium]